MDERWYGAGYRTWRQQAHHMIMSAILRQVAPHHIYLLAGRIGVSLRNKFNCASFIFQVCSHVIWGLIWKPAARLWQCLRCRWATELIVISTQPLSPLTEAQKNLNSTYKACLLVVILFVSAFKKNRILLVTWYVPFHHHKWQLPGDMLHYCASRRIFINLFINIKLINKRIGWCVKITSFIFRACSILSPVYQAESSTRATPLY